MQLRDRKAKPPKYASEEEVEKPMSRANRRKTIADVTTLPKEGDDIPPLSAAIDPKKAANPKARRSSMASSAGSINGARSSSLSFASSATVPPVEDPETVKKSRAPNTSRADPAKPRTSKPKPPIPPMPLAPRGTHRQSHNTVSNDNSSEPLAENGDLKDRDVDQLASGMTKMSIKLDVPSKEEQKIREAKRAQVAPRGRPKSTGTKNTPAAAMKTEKASKWTVENPAKTAKDNSKIRAKDLLSLQEAAKDVSSATAAGPAIQAENHNPAELQIVSPASTKPGPPSFSPPSAPVIAATAPIPETADMPPPIGFQKESASMPRVADIPSDLPSPPTPLLEPTTTTATPKHTKQNLPVFTPTSSIVFGKPSTPGHNIEQSFATQSGLGHPSEGEYPNRDRVDHPDAAPGKAKSIFDSQAAQFPAGQRGMHSDKQETTPDIFDVPETP
ncbi:MAG: hypothetical protein L6R42_010035 [Xanthoria sp. 1 TBL-2021]|nr:MAG: hypothetical protein L6R42_010035 [Xanthoria sp. 1 TBL-2021]